MIDMRQPPIVLHADQDHFGLRVVTSLLIPLSIWLAYWVLRQLFQLLLPGALPDYMTLAACILGLPTGLLLVALTERWLKRVWHSGNQITVAESQLVVSTRQGERVRIDLTREFVETNWTFRLRGFARGGSERRVPAHWHLIGTQLEQEDQVVVVYTLLSLPRLERLKQMLPGFYQEINPRDVYEPQRGLGPLPSRPTIPAAVLRGKHGRFWLAERQRWRQGMELAPQDYETLIQIVHSDGGSHV